MVTTRQMLHVNDEVFVQTPAGTKIYRYGIGLSAGNQLLGPRVSFGEEIWAWDDDFEKGEKVIFRGIDLDLGVCVALGSGRGATTYNNYCLLSRRPQEPAKPAKPGDVLEGPNGRRWLVSETRDRSERVYVCPLDGSNNGQVLCDGNSKFTRLGPFGEVYQEKPKV